MKRIALLVLCILALSFTSVNAQDVSQEDSIGPNFTYEELKGMFPQSNIIKYQELSVKLNDKGSTRRNQGTVLNYNVFLLSDLTTSVKSYTNMYGQIKV